MRLTTVPGACRRETTFMDDKNIESDQLELLAVAVIAAGMYANHQSNNWRASEIAHDAVNCLKEIKKALETLHGPAGHQQQ